MNLLLVAFALCGSKTLPVAPPLLPDWSFLTNKDFDQVCGMCGISILRCDTNTHMNSPADIFLTDGTFSNCSCGVRAALTPSNCQPERVLPAGWLAQDIKLYYKVDG